MQNGLHRAVSRTAAETNTASAAVALAFLTARVQLAVAPRAPAMSIQEKVGAGSSIASCMQHRKQRHQSLAERQAEAQGTAVPKRGQVLQLAKSRGLPGGVGPRVGWAPAVAARGREPPLAPPKELLAGGWTADRPIEVVDAELCGSDAGAGRRHASVRQGKERGRGGEQRAEAEGGHGGGGSGGRSEVVRDADSTRQAAAGIFFQKFRGNIL